MRLIGNFVTLELIGALVTLLLVGAIETFRLLDWFTALLEVGVLIVFDLLSACADIFAFLSLRQIFPSDVTKQLSLIPGQSVSDLQVTERDLERFGREISIPHDDLVPSRRMLKSA